MCDEIVLRQKIKLGQPLDPEDPEILRVSDSILENYLSSRDLVCSSERQVVKAILLWCLEDYEYRICVVDDVLKKCIRTYALEESDIEDLLNWCKANIEDLYILNILKNLLPLPYTKLPPREQCDEVFGLACVFSSEQNETFEIEILPGKEHMSYTVSSQAR